MTNTDFDWQIDEFMVYCRSTQLREKTMASYEQTLRLFERWCREQLNIVDVDKVTEAVIRRYINDLQREASTLFTAMIEAEEDEPPRQAQRLPQADQCHNNQ